jgi:quinol monooxygenase YgiN
MFGHIVKMTATSGRRDSLIDVIFEGIKNMPGCLSYIVAKDVANPDALWITEVWDSEASHKASLSLPAVRAAISKGQPLITGMGEPIITTPVGGHGLPG